MHNPETPPDPSPEPSLDTEAPADAPRVGGGKVDLALGVLNGVVGDYLHANDNGLAISMALHHEGKPVALTREALQRAYPRSTGRLALWVHGLAVTESIWAFPGDATRTYGAMLERDAGLTPLYLRYNTGLHVSENGAALARLLETLVTEFPVPIEELVLVGYSMGGLVVRSACHVAARDSLTWLSHVKQALYLGVPHLGSPLERVGSAVSWVLRAIPNAYTRLVADVADLRSNGVKDMGYANLLHEDWQDADPTVPLQNRRHPVPLLPTISHHLIAGALSRDERNWVSLLFGDGVVPVSSATGRAKPEDRSPVFPQENVKVVNAIDHVAIAHHEQVYALIREWFAPEAA
ncbi:alpha/beta hydrolase [Myxococcaceae bacterium JPH2]|nr:alpha/beta hydrolase [Myxococcaceae bacterium JPH2]